MTPLLSPKTSGKRPGKQIRKGLRLRGSKRFRDADKSCSGFARSLETAGYDRFRVLPMPEVAARPLRPAFCCFPHASPVFQTEAGKQKTAPKDRSKPLISLRKFGAGEGIRTLDPNLGKVVLLRQSISRSLRPQQAVECALPLRVPVSCARLTFGRH